METPRVFREVPTVVRDITSTNLTDWQKKLKQRLLALYTQLNTAVSCSANRRYSWGSQGGNSGDGNTVAQLQPAPTCSTIKIAGRIWQMDVTGCWYVSPNRRNYWREKTGCTAAQGGQLCNKREMYTLEGSHGALTLQTSNIYVRTACS